MVNKEPKCADEMVKLFSEGIRGVGHKLASTVLALELRLARMDTPILYYAFALTLRTVHRISLHYHYLFATTHHPLSPT